MEKDRNKARAITVKVESGDARRRLDNFLLSRLRGVPRSRVYRMIRGGEVRVNKGRARPDRRLLEGDEVRIPPVRTAPEARLPAEARAAAEWIQRRILYEDRDLLVLDKPPGLAVHGGSGVSAGAIELLRAARSGHDDLGLVHRLDRDTSGCLLIAKRRPVLRYLHELFRAGEVQKRYTALLIGAWRGGHHTVDAPLLTTRRRGGERHVTVDTAGKSALTRFIPEHDYGLAQLTTVEPATGRTHQIRVHAAHLGHPVAGDRRYGPDLDPVAQEAGLRRMFLHASSLAFESRNGERVIRADAPLDEELTAVLRRLEGPGGSAGSA
ncbi:MAG: RluA family pseudouridine synthase [Gammaproteobacteria bacterium]